VFSVVFLLAQVEQIITFVFNISQSRHMVRKANYHREMRLALLRLDLHADEDVLRLTEVEKKK